MRISAVCVLVALGSLALPSPGAAQSVIAQADSAARRLMARRDDLIALAQTLDTLAVSRTAGVGDRNRAPSLATQIRARLEAGDFQTGDRVVVRVTNEVGLADTFPVVIGPALVLPTVGEIPLRGVLRSEIEAHLARYVSGVIRDPEVHARALMRLSVQGEVARPGYYSVPPEVPLSDLVTAAGGYTTNAKLTDQRVLRGDAKVLEKERLRTLMAQGITLDGAGLRPGDELMVPKRKNTDVLEGFRLAAVLLGIPITIYTLTRLH